MVPVQLARPPGKLFGLLPFGWIALALKPPEEGAPAATMLKFSGCIVVPVKRGPKVLLAKTKTITDIITTMMTIMSSAMIVSMPRFDLRKRLKVRPRDFKAATPITV
jgi:hypothetical protein